MTMFKIVETDNFGGDYPNEKFLNLPPMREEVAKHLVDDINLACSGEHAPRFWKAVPHDYKLQPGFEP